MKTISPSSICRRSAVVSKVLNSEVKYNLLISVVHFNSGTGYDYVKFNILKAEMN